MINKFDFDKLSNSLMSPLKQGSGITKLDLLFSILKTVKFLGSDNAVDHRSPEDFKYKVRKIKTTKKRSLLSFFFPDFRLAMATQSETSYKK